MTAASRPASPSRRLKALMGGCAFLAAAVLGRAAYLQLIGDPRVENMARRQFSSKMLIRPRRGSITDRNGKPLAVNVEIQSLAANPTKVANRDALARLLAKSLDLPLKTVSDRLKGKREFIWIKRHLTEGDLNALKRFNVLDARGELAPGLWMVKESKRVYPHGELAAHLLGSVNLDSEGLEGVELWADRRLRGEVVSVSAVRDALGRPAFLDSVAAQGVKNGETLALTIDGSLQFAVEQELKAAVARTRSIGGSVVVMNAVSGEVLALANEPSFNPNQKAPPSVRRNRVVTDGYEPGSTMKAILLAGALENGGKLTEKVFGERGSFVVQGRRINEAEAHERFEWITLRQMLQVSSNVGAAKVALKLGPERFQQTLREFGLGERSGLGFPGEIAGMMPANRKWQPLTTANVGFGHGLLVTPIQMVRAYAAFFNGGWLVQPTLLKTPLEGQAPQPPRRILPGQVAGDVVEALLAVTSDEGTGKKAVLDGYRVAGKTGTAQKVDPKTGRYSKSSYIASFIGSAVDVEPKLVIFSSLDEPRTSIYASETAAPLFRAVLNAAAARFSIPAKAEPASVLASSQSALKAPGAVSDRLRTSLAKVSSPETAPAPEGPAKLEWRGAGEDGGMKWRMPALTGLTPREAMRMLRGRKFQVRLQGTGIVRGQSPEEGGVIQDGGMVRLELGEP